jgi:hypothetical protein
MRQISLISFVILAFVLAGCTSCNSKIKPMPTPTTSIALVTLSESQPFNEGMKIRLVNVGSDGVVTIQSLDSGAIIKSDANGFFPSKEFGAKGLQAQSINKEDKSVGFVRLQCGP